MPLDHLSKPAPSYRGARGLGSFHAGLAAEMAVSHHYDAGGDRVSDRRWRGSCGEIDLIVDAADGVTVFVEVKHAASHARAAERVTPAQVARIMATAEEYVGQRHGHLDVDMRFDLALVDRAGRVQVIENAFMH